METIQQVIDGIKARKQSAPSTSKESDPRVILTVKGLRDNQDFPDPIYVNHSYIVESIEGVVLWFGSKGKFNQDHYIQSGYVDHLEVKAREHDLYLNDNTKVA